jgi:biopolymer transport protein ExbD
MIRARFKKEGKKKTFFLPLLIPVMNLFLVLLPFVIETAFLQKLTSHELMLPTIKSGANNDGTSKHITLNIENMSVTIYLNGNEFSKISYTDNFQKRFEEDLLKIRKSYPEIVNIEIKVSHDVIYQNLIYVLDVCKKNSIGFQEVVYIDEVK